MNKFEQLIEFIINDEEAKAKELFHEVVVEKSREIYENLMQEEEDCDKDEKELDEAEDCDKDEKEDKVEESIEDEDVTLGGDAADDMMHDIQHDESGIAEDDDEDEEAVEVDSEEDEEELEDRVVDLEDKLDELMSEFEGLMNDNDAEGEELDGIEGDLEAEDDAEVEVEPGMNDVGTDDEELPMPMEEAVDLKPVKADHKDGTDSTANKSPILANGGAKEGLAEPHKIPSTDKPEKGRPAPASKELPHGTTEPNLSPAPAPVKQDTADNKKSVN